jgi:hypothetical protein
VQFQCLVKSLYLALGLRVVWRLVFLQDAKILQFVVKCIAAISKPCGEDSAVLGEG